MTASGQSVRIWCVSVQYGTLVLEESSDQSFTRVCFVYISLAYQVVSQRSQAVNTADRMQPLSTIDALRLSYADRIIGVLHRSMGPCVHEYWTATSYGLC